RFPASSFVSGHIFAGMRAGNGHKRNERDLPDSSGLQPGQKFIRGEISLDSAGEEASSTFHQKVIHCGIDRVRRMPLISVSDKDRAFIMARMRKFSGRNFGDPLQILRISE